MARTKKPVDDPFQTIAALESRLRTLERSSQLGRSTARGGTSKWAGTDGTVHVTVGDLGDGTYGLSTDGRVATSGHGAFLDLQTAGGQRIKFFAQSADPGSSDPDGAIRVWFQI